MVAAGVADHSDFQAWLRPALADPRHRSHRGVRRHRACARRRRPRAGDPPPRGREPRGADLLGARPRPVALGPRHPRGHCARHVSALRGPAPVRGPRTVLPGDEAFRRRVRPPCGDRAPGPPAPPTLAPARALLRASTAGLLPGELRGQFGLAWGPGRERAVRAGAVAIRRTLPVVPANIRLWPHAREAMARSEPKSGW